MAIAYVNKTRNLTTSTSASFSFDVGSGSNRLLIAMLMQRGGALRAMSSVTYNGVSLTQAGADIDETSLSVKLRVSCFYLVNPAAGSNTFAWSTANSTTINVILVAVNGAAQTSPYDKAGSSTSAGSNNPTVKQTPSNNGELIAACLLHEYDGVSTLNSGTSLYETSHSVANTAGAYTIQTTAGEFTFDWTAGGSENYAAGCWSFKPDTGGTAYNQSASGAISPAGELVRQGQPVKAGAISPGGAILRRAQPVKAGAITPAGTAVKQTRTAMTGTVSIAGALSTIKTRLMAITGAIGPSGAISRAVQAVRSGAIGPSGARSRLVSVQRTGVLTAGGNLVKSTWRALAGVLSSLGDLIGQWLPPSTTSTPETRTLHITHDIRSLAAPGESRSSLVEADNRTLEVR